MKISTFYQHRYNEIPEGVARSTLNIWQEYTYADLSKESLKGLKICEIGVGPMGILYKLTEEFPDNDYYGIDLDDVIIKGLTKKGVTVKAQDISSERVDFPDNLFDIIIFNEVIEHLFDCQHAMNEIYRLLKPEGRLYISTHNSFNLAMRISFLLGRIPTGSLDVTGESMGEHIRLFNSKILLTLAERAGFDLSKSINHSWFKLGKISFFTGFFTSLLARHFYYIFRK